MLSLFNNRILTFHRLFHESEKILYDDYTDNEFDRVIDYVFKFHKNSSLKNIDLSRNKMLFITFDDGYADNYNLVLPILMKHKIKATFFVASGYLDGGWMWNDGIEEAVKNTTKQYIDLTKLGYQRYVLNTDNEKIYCINDLLNKIKYLENQNRIDLAKRVLDYADVQEPTHLMMTSAQVRAMHHAGMEIGGHTVNHPILAKLDKKSARSEIFENKEYLESLIGEQIQSFAYPNGKSGKDYNFEHVSLVKQAGYKCAVSTDRGLVTKHSDYFQLPRLSIWGRNPLKFTLRMYFNF